MRLESVPLLFFSAIISLVVCCVADDQLPGKDGDPIIQLRLGNPRPQASFFTQIAKLFAPRLIRERLRRHLAIGDFNNVNGLINGFVFEVAESVSTSSSVLGGTLDLDLSNIRCDSVEVGDITVAYEKISDQNFIFSPKVVEFDLNCYFDWGYYYDSPFGGWADLRGSGKCDAFTENNSASLSLRFDSSDFSLEPPTSVVNNPNEKCSSKINIETLTFSGGFASLIANIAKTLFEEQIEATVENQICSVLDSVGGDLGNELLAGVNELLAPFLDESDFEYGDPLDPENSLDIASTTSLLNYLEAGVASDALDELNDFVGGNPPGINTFLQDNLLDDDGALTLNITDFNFTSDDGFNITTDDGVIYDEHNNFTEAKISVESVRVFGLDSFTSFGPFKAIGKYTLNSSIVLSSISIEVTLNFNVKPSTLPGSLNNNPGAAPINTVAQIVFGVDDIDASLSALLAVDEVNGTAALQATDNVVGCLLSSVAKVETSGLDINIGNLKEPTLSGFLAPGIDRIAAQTAEAVLIMYESTVIQAMENFLKQTLGNILLPVDLIASSAVCESSQSPSSSPSQYPSISPSTIEAIPNTTDVFELCFSGDSTVELENGDIVPMNQLSIGDAVLVSLDGKYEAIYGFGHFDTSSKVQFLQIQTTNTPNSPLEITPNHLVFVNSQHVIPASKLKVGDGLLFSSIGTMETITSIQSVTRTGAFAPFTPSGKIMTNGIQSSCFASLDADAATVSLGGYKTPVTYHLLGLIFESPRRLMCKVLDCRRYETYSNGGLSKWVAVPMQGFLWLKRQNIFVSGVIFILAVTSFAMINAAEMAVIHPVVTFLATLVLMIASILLVKSKKNMLFQMTYRIQKKKTT